MHHGILKLATQDAETTKFQFQFLNHKYDLESLVIASTNFIKNIPSGVITITDCMMQRY